MLIPYEEIKLKKTIMLKRLIYIITYPIVLGLFFIAMILDLFTGMPIAACYWVVKGEFLESISFWATNGIKKTHHYIFGYEE